MSSKYRHPGDYCLRNPVLSILHVDSTPGGGSGQLAPVDSYQQLYAS